MVESLRHRRIGIGLGKRGMMKRGACARGRIRAHC